MWKRSGPRFAAPALRGTALPERRGLAHTLAQEVELRPPRDTMAHDLDLLDARRVHLERALDAYPAAQRAHGNRSVDAATAQAHDGAFEDLDALAVAFLDSRRHLH